MAMTSLDTAGFGAGGGGGGGVDCSIMPGMSKSYACWRVAVVANSLVVLRTPRLSSLVSLSVRCFCVFRRCRCLFNRLIVKGVEERQ